MTKVLELALMGELRLSLDGQPIPDLTSSKAQALLCYLAVTGRAQSRYSLAALLWGQMTEADGRRNLRGVLMRLRQHLEPYLLVTHHTIAFDHEGGYWLDVEAFKANMTPQPGGTPSPEQLERALALYRGDFLQDFHLRNAPAFEDWVSGQRTGLREMAIDACHRLAIQCAHQAEYAQGIAHARRMLSLDALREEGWQQLIHMLTLNGQRNAALAEYEACRTVLREELGIEPSPETAALVQRIRIGDLHPAPAVPREQPIHTPLEHSVMADVQTAAAPQLTPYVAGPPIIHPRHFFGRERELSRLFGLIKQTPLQNAAIIGSRRSGKTSLLHYLKEINTTEPSQLRPGQRHDWLPQPGRYRWIFVDFQDPRMGSVNTLLSLLLTRMELPTPQPCTMESFLDIAADALHGPTIILLDEIGVALQRYPDLDDAFWEGLRSLATNQSGGNLGFILTGSQSPGQLAQHSGYGSPFFNIFGYTAYLSPLSESAAEELVRSSPIPFPEEDIAWMMEHSGRWPVLLQLLCRERLLSLEEGESGDAWRQDALRQMAPFKRTLAEQAP